MAKQRVRVKQTRSAIKQRKGQIATLKALGLGRIGREKEHRLVPEIMGMVRKVSHLVEIEKVGSNSGPSNPR